MDWKRNEEAWLYPKVEAADKLKTEECNNFSKNKIGTILKPNSNDLHELICGWGSAVINITVTYPINKIIFRQASYMFSTKSIFLKS